MTLDRFYELTKGGTIVYKWDDEKQGYEEMTVNQHTKCHLFDVIYFRAVENDLIEVYVE